MKKDPFHRFTTMLWLLSVLVAALPLISLFEKEKTPDWYPAFSFPVICMWFIHAVFKHMKKRIDELEQNQSKE